MSNTWNKSQLKSQLTRVMTRGWIEHFQKEAQRAGTTTSHLLALASRETNIENIRGDFRQDIYHGYGVIQIDIGTDPNFAKTWSPDNWEAGLTGGVNIYLQKCQEIRNKVGKQIKITSRGKVYTCVGKAVDEADIRRIATSAYNTGSWAYYSFSTGKDIDQTTTGKDYGKDVYARAIIFAELLDEIGLETNSLQRELELQENYTEKHEEKNMSIIPSKKPNIPRENFDKIAKYFLDDEVYNQAVIILGIRQSRINFYDDECAILSNGTYKTFNFNTEPSELVKGSKSRAVLRKGLHYFTLSYHHKYDSKRYVALNPLNSKRELPVLRQVNGKWVQSIGVAINIHKGGSQNTFSEGCQTFPNTQYDEAITLIGKGLGLTVPLGIISKPKTDYVNGIGKIAYILIDQKDYNYIMNLDENLFDEAEDLSYQNNQFVGIVKALPDVSNPEINDSHENEVIQDSFDEPLPDPVVNQEVNISGNNPVVSTSQNEPVKGGGVNDSGKVLVKEGQSWPSLLQTYYLQILGLAGGVFAFLKDNPVYLVLGVVLIILGVLAFKWSKERSDARNRLNIENAENPQKINVNLV